MLESDLSIALCQVFIRVEIFVLCVCDEISGSFSTASNLHLTNCAIFAHHSSTFQHFQL